MLQFKLSSFTFANIAKQANIMAIYSYLNDNSYRAFKLPKVLLDVNSAEFTMQKITSLTTNDEWQLLLDANGKLIDEAKVESNSVKTTVRIDDDLFNALCNATDKLKSNFNGLINLATPSIIKSGEIYLLPTRKFSHRITIHFPLKDYNRIQEIVYDFKQKGIKCATFSLIVRSILYEALAVVIDIDKPIRQKSLKDVA